MQISVIKKTVLLVLLLVTGSAWAAWEEVAASDSIDFYFDPASIRKDGNLVRVWEIQNLKQRYKNGELSRRLRVEYDCKQERFRNLSFSNHSEAMASGTNLISGSPNGEWQDIPPRTPVERMLKIVCAK